MLSFRKKAQNLADPQAISGLRDTIERGATAIEYSLMVGLIAVGIVAAVGSTRDKINSTLSKASPLNEFRLLDGAVSASTGTVSLSREGNNATGSLKWDGPSPATQLSGTWTGNTMTLQRDCTAIYSPCLQTWNATQSADGTWSGTYVWLQRQGYPDTPSGSPGNTFTMTRSL